MSTSVASPPAAPNPTTVAAQQTGLNVGTGVGNSYLGNANTYTPFGQTVFANTGQMIQVPDGKGGYVSVPQFSSTTTLNPETESALNGALNTVQNPSTKIASGVDQNTINDSLNAYLARVNPSIALQQKALDTQLINMGFSPDPQSGTNAYNEAQLLNTQRNNDLLNSGYQTAFQTALQQAQLQNAANAQEVQQAQGTLGIINGVSQGPAYNAGTIAPTNIGDYYMNENQVAGQEYGTQAQAQATQMAGLYGAIGNVVGAGLYGGAKFSDRRVKTDIERIGTWSNGLPIYLFRYIFDPLRRLRVGFMAQDVEKLVPEAVFEVGGIKAVRYDLAMAARNG